MQREQGLLDLVRTSWRASPPALRKLVRLLFGVGIVCILLGTALDVFDLWGGLSFLTNLLAGLAGACIGIPFAALVLSGVFEERDSREKSRAIWSQFESRLNMVEFDAKELTRTGDISEVRRLMVRLNDLKNGILFSSVTTGRTEDGEELDLAARAEVARQHALRTLGPLAEDLTALLTRRSAEDGRWVDLKADWRIITDVIIERALVELGDDIIQPTDKDRLDAYVTRGSPFFYVRRAITLIEAHEDFPESVTARLAAAPPDPTWPRPEVDTVIEEAAEELKDYARFRERLADLKAANP